MLATSNRCWNTNVPPATALKQEAGLRLDASQLIRQGGDSGSAVVPDKADESLLLERVASEPADGEGTPLKAKEIALVRAWIAQGAKAPEHETFVADPRQHWSHLPARRPPIPDLDDAARALNPIDSFIAAKYAELGLTPRPEAENPLPFATPGAEDSVRERREQLDLLQDLNNLAGVQYPDDPALRARVKAYELASRMQLAAPEVMAIDRETTATQKLYGLDDKTAAPFGKNCLAARRLVERGVRFVQVYHPGSWDAHSKLKDNHTKNCARSTSRSRDC